MIFKSAGHSAVKGKNYDPGAVGKTTANIQVTEAELTQDFENLVLAELTKKKFIRLNQDGTIGQYKEVQKVVKFIKLKSIKMSNNLDSKDLAYVQNLIIEERKLHKIN